MPLLPKLDLISSKHQSAVSLAILICGWGGKEAWQTQQILLSVGVAGLRLFDSFASPSYQA
jgi:hypothetical protein